MLEEKPRRNPPVQLDFFEDPDIARAAPETTSLAEPAEDYTVEC